MSSLSFTTEKDVENYYREGLQAVTGARFKSPYNTDGVIEWLSPSGIPTRVLFEAKLSHKLQNPKGRAKALAQAVYYLRQFAEDTEIPNVVLIGDKTHYFSIAAINIYDFINFEGVDWERAPSSPCPNLVKALESNDVIQDVYVLDLPIDAKLLKETSEQLAEHNYIKAKATVSTLPKLFIDWSTRVYTKSIYTPATQVDIFLAFLCHKDSRHAYIHPAEPNTIVVNGDDYRVNVKELISFFNFYERGYSPLEIDRFMAMRDTLLEEENRRRQGAFYTNSLWANEAINLLDEQLGENWREECIVWDCCCGTANLTRSHSFSNLILSTAEQADVDAIKRESYNAGAHVFQYDFLNPNAESLFEIEDNRLPLAVENALKEAAAQGKRLVFFINPPYATAGNAGAKGTSKAGVSKTIANTKMKEAKLGACSQQLYAQFLFQCEQVASEYGFERKSVGVFSPTLFMTSSSFAKFRPFWYERYIYQSGMMFQASHFADVKGSWAISFTLWSEGKTENEEISLILKDKSEEGQIISLQEKLLYSTDEAKASNWVSIQAPKSTNIDTPKFSSGLKIKDVKENDKGVDHTSVGVLCNDSNNVMKSGTGVFLLSGKPTNKKTCNFGLTKGESWCRAIALYSARKLITATWENQKDEYLVPNTEHPDYDQWVDDCHIYALLHISNNMTSMRDVEYKGKKWQIHNHFFWLTRAQALDMFNTSASIDIYRDCQRSSHEPYFAEILPTLNLSPLAREILNDLTAVLKSSLPLRQQADQELHLKSWDAGVYQLNKLLKDDDAWKALKAKHRLLRDQLEHGVYTFGFLR